MLLLRSSTLIENIQSDETDPVLLQEPILIAVQEDLQHCKNIAGSLQCSKKMSQNPFRAAKPLDNSFFLVFRVSNLAVY